MRLPTLPVTRLRLFATLPVASAAIISFDSVRHLAESAGFGPLAWLFPLTMDAAVAFGTDLWIRRKQSAAMSKARALALTVMAGSLVANTVDHYMTGSILGGLLGAVPPTVLAWMLLVLHQHGLGEADQDAPDQTDRFSGPGPVAISYTVPRFLAVPRSTVHVESDRAMDATVRELVQIVRTDGEPGPVPNWEKPDRTGPLPQPRKRTSAARTPATTVRRSATAKAPEDREIVAWISDQPTAPTKQQIMDRYPIGSGRALRLRTAATAKESTDE
jgi:hypothetical protein